ncbi:MAG: signal peptidase [Candidatus Dependentiae bacterium]|nr:signal peptidase [Candidatus Dependentiae bacterium]
MRLQQCDWIFAFTTVGAFIVDRLSKVYALQNLVDQDIVLFPGCKFSLIFNTGISFSLFSSSSGMISWELTCVIAVIVALLIVGWRYYALTPLADVGFGLIIGGAVGNFVDRLAVGGVIDFIELYYRQWSWPTFNVADIAIVIGFLLIAGEALYEAKTQ